jgi:GNAT superfamily N-acetyltransferase
MDVSTPVHGLVAQDDTGALLGLAHFRPFARPLSASTGGFMDDLFVAPQGRGHSVADHLIQGVRDHGAAQGWSVIRWITAEDNYRARAVYDRLADKTKWVTYDIKL